MQCSVKLLKGATERRWNAAVKTFEDYRKALLEQASQYLREKLLAQADEDGLNVWELTELAAIGAEP